MHKMMSLNCSIFSCPFLGLEKAYRIWTRKRGPNVLSSIRLFCVWASRRKKVLVQVLSGTAPRGTIRGRLFSTEAQMGTVFFAACVADFIYFFFFLFGLFVVLFLASLCFLHALALSLTGAQRTDSSLASKKKLVWLIFFHGAKCRFSGLAFGCVSHARFWARCIDVCQKSPCVDVCQKSPSISEHPACLCMKKGNKHLNSCRSQQLLDSCPVPCHLCWRWEPVRGGIKDSKLAQISGVSSCGHQS